MNKTGLLLLFICFLNAALFAQQCPSPDLTFNRQEQIDSFSTNFPTTEVVRDVFIMGSAIGTITNLNGLNQIKTIKGELAFMSRHICWT